MKSKQALPKPEQVAAMIQDLILQKMVLPGERLPSERELAGQLGISRPAVHEGLLLLEMKGLITMRPRHGSVVNDFHNEASVALLTELYRSGSAGKADEIVQGLVEFRQLILSNIIDKCIEKTRALPLIERNAFFKPLEAMIDFPSEASSDEICAADFNFYKTLITLSANPVYRFFFDAAKEIYIHEFRLFLYKNPKAVTAVPIYKKEFIAALRAGKKNKAKEIMIMLTSTHTYRGVHP